MKKSKIIDCPVSNRLKKYCENNGITQIELVNKGFASAQTVNNYLNAYTEPKSNFLEKFIKEYRVSAIWLMTGNTDKNTNYENKGIINVFEEPVITKYSCPDCIDKQNEINRLNAKLVEIQDKYITLKDLTTEGDLKQKCG